MRLETVGKPRLRREKDLLPGRNWFRVMGPKKDLDKTRYSFGETRNSFGFGVTPESAYECFTRHDPFAEIPDDCPF